MPDPEPPAAPARQAERALAYVLLAVLTVELAVWGAFLVPLRVGDQLLPVCWLVAVAGNLATGWLGAGIGGRTGAAVPGLLWLGVVLVLSTKRSEGDLVVTGGLVGLVFLCAGALASVVVCALAPVRRSRPT